MKPYKILVVGTGAIGGFYGALLAKAGAEVSVVSRSDYDTVVNHGYTIQSETLGNWTFSPDQIVRTAAEYKHIPDFIILCTKVIPEINRAELIKPAVQKQTSIVFIQNGIDIEPELATAFPNNELISGLAFICCNRTAPGVIKHLAYGKLSLGHLPNTPQSEKIQHLSHLIQQSGIEALVSDDIIGSRWLKCLWNASFNPLSVLSDGLSTKEIIENQEPLIRTIMQEVSSIADAAGHRLPDDSIDININNTYAMPPYKTSMLLDFERQHPMETEAILGNTVRYAKRLGIACPVLETVYSLMKLKELK